MKIFEDCSGNCDDCPDKKRCQSEKDEFRKDLKEKIKKVYPRLDDYIIDIAVDEIINGGTEDEMYDRLEKIAKKLDPKRVKEIKESINNSMGDFINSQIKKNFSDVNPMNIAPIICPPGLPVEEVEEAIKKAVAEVEKKYHPWRGEFLKYQDENFQYISEESQERFSLERAEYREWIETKIHYLMEKVGKTPEEFSLSEQDIGEMLTETLLEKKKEEDILFQIAHKCDEIAKSRDYEEAAIQMDQFQWLRTNRKSEFLRTTVLKLFDIWNAVEQKRMIKKYGEKPSTSSSNNPISEEEAKGFSVDDFLDNFK